MISFSYFRVVAAAAACSLGVLLAGPGLAQGAAQNVPSAVRTAYAARFKAPAPAPRWDRRTGNRWEAAYREPDGSAAVATFDKAGTWLETTHVRPLSELPAPARAYIATQNPKKLPRRAARITTADGTRTWQARVEGQALLFDHTGHLLRTGRAPRAPGARKARKTAVVLPAATPTPVPVAAAAQ